MFKEAYQFLNENQSIKSLLDKLNLEGFVYEPTGQTTPLTSDDVIDAWKEYQEGGAEAAVSYLETFFGFVFNQEEVHECLVSSKDWARMVRAAREILQENPNEKSAIIKLHKMFSFLSEPEAEEVIQSALRGENE